MKNMEKHDNGMGDKADAEREKEMRRIMAEKGMGHDKNMPTPMGKKGMKGGM